MRISDRDLNQWLTENCPNILRTAAVEARKISDFEWQFAKVVPSRRKAETGAIPQFLGLFRRSLFEFSDLHPVL